MAVPKIILAKKEATYGTDAVPTNVANAILTRNYRETPLEVDQLDRNLDRASRGRTQSAPTNHRATRSFEVEIAGSGTAGTAPPWMELLEACGMEPPALTADTDAKQKFAAFAASLSSLTFYDTVGNLLSKGLGSRGSFGWNFTVGAYPFFNLNFTCLVPPAGPIAEGTLSAPSLGRWRDPLEVNVDNTEVLAGGIVAKMLSFTGDIAANVGLKNNTGERFVRRGNHAVTGNLRIKVPNLATRNYWLDLRGGGHIALAVQHGKTAGNIVDFKSSNLQVLQIAVVDEDDELLIDMSYGLDVVAGQDDLLLVAR